MKKLKYCFLLIFMFFLIFFIPNSTKAIIDVSRDIVSGSGNITFTFSGLEVEETKNYEFALMSDKNAEIDEERYIDIDSKTSDSITFTAKWANSYCREVLAQNTTGYISIRDKESKQQLLTEVQEVDLTIPFLLVTNYSVIENGKEFGTSESELINVATRNARTSSAKYQYEKITDETVISKYKEIKEKSGDILELQPLLKTTTPKANWSAWNYWNGYVDSGYGRPQNRISVPEIGLYYLWVYFTGNYRDLYGYILVDNLQPEITLESISLPQTANVELGKTLRLTVSYNPSTATNKIVTWTSSDETIATVDASGLITPKKIGSVVITATSEDGNKVASCTVTVLSEIADTDGNGSGSNGSGSGSGNSGSNNGSNVNNGGNGSNGTGETKNPDATKSPSGLPFTGTSIYVTIGLLVTTSMGILYYIKCKKYKGI